MSSAETQIPLERPAPESMAIVGMECLFPGARNLASYWRNIIRGVDALTEIPPSRWDPKDYDLLHTTRGGFIEGLTEFDPLAYGIMPAALHKGDPEQFLVYGVVHRALLDMFRGRRFLSGPGWQTGVQDVELGELPQRTEVVIGRGGYSGSTVEHAYLRMEFVAQVNQLLRELATGASPEKLEEIRKLLIATFPVGSPEMMASSIPNLTSGRVANRLDFQGGHYNVDAACASALIATEQVIRSLRDGRCDLGVAAAVHLVQKPYFWLAFEILHAPSPTNSCRPFSVSADGLMMGEGIGAVILKRLSDAQRDGDRIYAILRGVGTAGDGRGVGVLSPRKEGQILAMKRAYEETGLDPQSISLIEAHGTGMPVGDATEIASLHEVFGKEGHGTVALGSVKSMIGHTMPAAGMAGLIKAALSVYHRILPPTLHVEQAHPDLKDGRLFVNTKVRPWIMPPELPRRAGVNAFGFGGINSHAILEDLPGEGRRESLTPRSSELFLMSAESRTELLARLDAWTRVLPSLADEELRDVAFSECRRYTHTHAERLAVVAVDCTDLAEKLAHARKRLQDSEEESWYEERGICFGTTPYEGKIAFLFPGLAFPGLAGGYTERLGELCLHFPEARAFVDFGDSVTEINENFPYPLRYQFFPPPLIDTATFDRLERELIWSRRTAVGQMIASLATGDLLNSLGVKADAMSGFSLGEWAALLAAGVLDRDGYRDIMNVWKALGNAPEELTGSWGMVAAPVEQVESILRQVSGRASIIMDGAATQTFFAGEVTAVREALQRFRELKIYGQEIPFPAIHTELAAPLVEGLKAMKSAMPVKAPAIPIYCGMNGKLYPDDPDQICDWLIESHAEPIRGVTTIQSMYRDGVRIFIELGIGGRMPQSILGILGDAPHVSLSVDWRRQGGLEQLHKFLGRLATLGVPFTPMNLYQNRPCRLLDPTTDGAAARKAAPVLSMAPPRFHMTDEARARLREILRSQPPAPAAPMATPVPAAPPQQPAARVAPPPPAPKPAPVPEKSAPLRTATTPRPAPRPTPTPAPVLVPERSTPVLQPAAPGMASILTESMATMQRFLQVQQEYEETETNLLTTYLATQEAALTSFLQSGNGIAISAALPMPESPVAPRNGHHAPVGVPPSDGLVTPPEGGTPAAAYPFVGEIQRLIPEQELESRLVLDLDKHLFLGDHAFIRVPDWLKPTSERLPILPMTVALEIFAEVAAVLAPGWEIVACHDAEANRWISLDSTSTTAVLIRGRRLSETEVDVELRAEGQDKAALRGRVTLGRSLPPAPAPLEVQGEQPCPHEASELYSIPLMFHGERFHVVTKLHGMSDSTISADLKVRDPAELLSTPLSVLPILDPMLLDGVGQVIGYKMLLDDWVVYPSRLGRLTRHAPTPPAGTTVRLTIRYRKLDGRRVTMDADVTDGAGNLWLHIEKWQDWRLLWPKELSEFSRRPHDHPVGIPWPVNNPRACCSRMRPKFFGEISPDWIARYCLTASEWATYRQRPRGDWLLGRIALKDAVRDWFVKHRGRVLYHLEVEIANLPSGAPVLVSPRDEALAISVSHLADDAIALVAEAPGVGIDLAQVQERGPEFRDFAFEADERELLAGMEGDALAWLHRAWCAKEAVAKAHGVGLDALPRFRIRAVQADGTIEVEHLPEGKRHAVETHLDADRVIATVTLA